MRTAKVVVLPYDEAWKDAFEKIKKELEDAISGLIIGIEHVGSTSVAGLSAKPCIDIDVIIKDYSVFDSVVKALADIGYVHEGDLGIKDREAFKYSDKPHLMSHHLYVCPQYSKELHRHITFRDFLRANPEAVRKYGEVKMKAAELFCDDIDKYIAYKSPCIEEIYRQCGLEITKNKHIIMETERLLIREYTTDDFDALYEILSDAETMKYYPKPYDENGVKRWINWCLDSYEKNGFGLWALELKSDGTFIGDCGISMQCIDGETLPEIGYHVNKKYWRRGYAKEACAAVKAWLFNNTDYNCVYSYMNSENVASYSTAASNGMTRVKEYNDGSENLFVYAITREEWEAEKEKTAGEI